MALPAYMYGNPAEAVDRRRAEAKSQENLRIKKSRRIQAIVKKVMKGKRAK